ncbi:uncharacterized protein PRCAT00004773001 [Priceomyces carsonii]|uniref:uncharacterized protein n=1 Tax=Priceomyces carsonii TaxID=28549 RepID=UPI002EDB378A|nr:unnamed protein product [Priceomyces carsonii]
MSEPEEHTTTTTKKKSVDFAPLPEEDLREHHEELRKKEEVKKQSNPFQKIPPEFSHLQKKASAPEPLASEQHKKKTQRNFGPLFDELGELRYLAVKDISVQNKETELNFNYPEIWRPIPSDRVLVDITYASLNSLDLAKINRYLLNVSDVKVGLGYEFAGKIQELGKSFKTSGEYSIGDTVIGLINPLSKKGSLSTSQLITPSRDILIKIDEDTLNKAESIDIQLSFNKSKDNDNFEIESSSSSGSVTESEEAAIPPSSPQTRKQLTSISTDLELPPLAKLTSFPTLYCRAKQLLRHSSSIFESTRKANILINGGDTNVGFTILQLLNSSVYSTLSELNVILIVKESSTDKMQNFLSHFTKGSYYDPSKIKRFQLVSYDVAYDDIILPGEIVPVNYKKPDFFASQVLGALLRDDEPGDKTISKSNINDYKLDLIIDIIGSKKYFQKSVKFNRIDGMNLPLRNKLAEGSSLVLLFNGKVKEPFLKKLLKPKADNSAFVSACGFNVSQPTYSIDKLIDYSGSLIWSSKWASDLANSYFTNYNYYEEIELKFKREWVIEGLNLFLKGQLKFRIDDYLDWRNNFKKYVKLLKNDDGKVIFKIESF